MGDHMKNSLSGMAFVLPLAIAAVVIGETPESPAADFDLGAVQVGGRFGGESKVQYGADVPLGNGVARAYVVFEEGGAQSPLEVGVAISGAGMYGLPEAMTMLHLPLPGDAPAPYQFVMLDWNPEGHEPEGIYTSPHFDIHFYTAPHSVVESIDPLNPTFAEMANALPREGFVPEHFFVLAAPGDPPAAVAVPKMGVHWSDMRSPELQAVIGKPEANRPFTKTFLYGSWDGRFIFLEPMVTREFLLSNPSEVVPIPQPARYPEAGWYPNAYRVEFDEASNEYRIALTGLVWYE
jgi:hypothetical protein